MSELYLAYDDNVEPFEMTIMKTKCNNNDVLPDLQDAENGVYLD